MPAINNAIYDNRGLGWWDDHDFMAILRIAINPPRFDYFREVLTNRLKLTPQSLSVLDVGSGGGLLSEEFARLGCDVTGVDFSEAAVQAAREHAALSGLNVKYMQGDAARLPFQSESFDVVCCCDVLEHVDSVETVIAEIARVLKPGGVFFYDTINRTLLSKLVAIKLAQDWRLTRFVPRDVHVWDKFIRPAELELLINTNGMHFREAVGLSPSVNPFKPLAAFIGNKTGQLSFAQMGERIQFSKSRNRLISYMGFALRSNANQSGGDQHKQLIAG